MYQWKDSLWTPGWASECICFSSKPGGFKSSSVTTKFQVCGEHTVKPLANKMQEMKRADMKKRCQKNTSYSQHPANK